MHPVAGRFGLRVAQEKDEGNYTSVLYLNHTTGLEVAVDWSELRPFLTMYELHLGQMPEQPLVRIGRNRRRAFDLDDLLVLRSPSASPAGKMLGSRDESAAARLLDEYASALECHAADVLSGQFGVFDELDEIVKHREQASGRT
jgi:hypothetical protein